MDVGCDSIVFCAGRKPEPHLGKVEWSWAAAVGSGVPAPPVWTQGRWRWAAHIGPKPKRSAVAQVSAKG